MTLKKATYENSDGDTVTTKVGDYVGFKSDYEHVGRVTSIRKTPWGGYEFTVSDPNGFGGDYLRYATQTTVTSDRVWEV